MTEVGALAGGPPTRMQVATAIADVRARFDACWPPAQEVLPMRVTSVQRWMIEHESYWRTRAGIEAEVLGFAQGATLHDAEEIEVAADLLMAWISSSAESMLTNILETRPALS